MPKRAAVDLNRLNVDLCFLRFRGLLCCDLFYRAGWKIEADLTVLGIEGEVGVELALGAVGDEAFEDVGPAKAERMITWRKKNGGFKRIADIRRVKGFGYKTFKRLEPYLDVAGPTTLTTQ